MDKIALEVSKAIQLGKWLMISYLNKNGENTCFWCSIIDIDPIDKIVTIDMFNDHLNADVLKGTKISYDQILYAHVIDGTYYERPLSLLKKIENDPLAFSFLEFMKIDDKLLDYYIRCYHEEGLTYYTDYDLLEGIDLRVIEENGYLLNQFHFHSFIQKINYKEKAKQQKKELYVFAINELAITIDEKLYPIVYRSVVLDVEHRQLHVSKTSCFNLKSHDENDKLKFDVTQFIEIEPHVFIETYQEKQEEYKLLLKENLRKGQNINEMPYFFTLKKHIKLNIEQEYENIKKSYQTHTLSAPLEAFWGLKQKKRRRNHLGLVLTGMTPNSEQLATIYNALNQDITYVQGPPGTGKTATIVQVILTHFFHQKTVLISSNNNEALENIYDKLEKSAIPLPILRLGNNDCLGRAIKKIKEISNMEHECIISKQDVLDLFTNLNQLVDAYETNKELEEELDAVKTCITKIEASDMDSIEKAFLMLPLEAYQTEIIEKQNRSKPLEIPPFNESIVSNYLTHQSSIYLNKVRHNKKLLEIVNMKEEDALKAFKAYLSDDKNMKELLKIFPIIFSTNLSCIKLGSAKVHFDLLIMDEASQSSVAISLLALARANRCLLVGDQNQLKPVVTLDPRQNAHLKEVYDVPKAYDYNQSILTTMLAVDSISKFILLKKHYRCHPKIIQFSNQKYYDNQLEIVTKETSGKISLLDITGIPSSKKNTSITEVRSIIEEIKRSTLDVAVITPFRSQAQLLREEFYKEGLDAVKVGTIHTFQGDEKDKIIISSALSDQTTQGSYDWIKNNQQLLNVACTRAKKELVLAVDIAAAAHLSGSRKDDFNELISYIKSNGTCKSSYSENTLFETKVKNYKYFNTKEEELFFETILHFKTTISGVITIRQKVKVTDVLHITEEEKELFMYANQAHFDFVLYNGKKEPFLAIEVNGYEHYNNKKVIERDHKKREIASNHNMTLLTIHNDYIRRYNYISKLILDLFH